MAQPNINVLHEDTEHIYISWNFMYFSPPPTVNFKTGKYTLPHNQIKMAFNSLISYPVITKLDKIKRSSLDSELGIRSDHFKNIYNDLKRNKTLFLDLKEIANSIPNIGIKITKEDKESTPHYIIPINKFNNVYNVVVMYVNNYKIPMILSAMNHTSITFISNIDAAKKKINVFGNIQERICLNKKLCLAYLVLDFETLFYLCTKYVPCVSLILKPNFGSNPIKNFQIH